MPNRKKLTRKKNKQRGGKRVNKKKNGIKKENKDIQPIKT